MKKYYMKRIFCVFQFVDKLPYPAFVSIVGNLAMAMAFLFIGPVPFIGLVPTVPRIYGMVTLAGFAYALVVVSTFARCQGSAMKLGYKDDVSTYLLISGEVIIISNNIKNLKEDMIEKNR